MYDFMFMLHNKNSNKVKSLNLKTCKSINLQTTGYPYLYGQSLKKDERPGNDIPHDLVVHLFLLDNIAVLK